MTLPQKSGDKNLTITVCVNCAKDYPTYCKKHKMAHMVYHDGHTACLMCIEEMVEKKKSEGFSVWKEIKEELPKEELLRLIEWAEFDSFTRQDLQENSMIRAVVTKAFKTNQEIETIMGEVLYKKSVSSILPASF